MSFKYMKLSFELEDKLHEIQVEANDVLYVSLLKENWDNYSVYYKRSKLDLYTPIRLLNLVNHATLSLIPIKHENIQVSVTYANEMYKQSVSTLTTFGEISKLVTNDSVEIRIQNTIVNLKSPCQLSNFTKIVLSGNTSQPSYVHSKKNDVKPEIQKAETTSVNSPIFKSPSLTADDNLESSDIDRHLTIYKPTNSQQRIEMSDDFFTLTGTELKYLVHQQLNYTKSLDPPLRTQAMRDKEYQQKLEKSPRVFLF
eukprot:NODE_286_length_10728_cov_0.553298.p6 type:complete len:255 gc:universal NODE_286_length_10728_cov_0.553298:7370-8134(+)